MTDETEQPPPDDARTFFERLRDVANDVSYMEKGGFNAHFKYAFLQEAEVKRAVGAALRRHGLLIARCEYRPLGVPTGQSAVLSCTLTIASVANDNGEGPYAEFQGVGGGADSSDKAPMKACAAALKYALTSGFLIATGDDPEEDGGTKAAPKSRARKTTEAPEAPDARQLPLPGTEAPVPPPSAASPEERAATALKAISDAADRKALTKLSLPLAALSREIPKETYEAVRLAYVARVAALKEAS
jgi:ERF superfamily